MTYGFIVASGLGQRMKSDIPKQFLKICNRSVISYPVEVFAKSAYIDKTIILVPRDWIDYTKETLTNEIEYPLMETIEIIEGGEYRNETIYRGIEYIKRLYNASSDSIIVTHDGVRPFITDDIIKRNIESIGTYTACDTVIPAVDTIVESNDGSVVTEVTDRSKLFHSQTPQTFVMGKYEDIYNSLTLQEKKNITDIAKMFSSRNEVVGMVNGSVYNIKITYPLDLIIAEVIIKQNAFRIDN